MFLMTSIVAASMFTAVASVEYSDTSDVGVDATTCVCTTVPCPVEGNNYLAIPGGGTGTYVYTTHSNHAVVSSASLIVTAANMDKGSDTTSCT